MHKRHVIASAVAAVVLSFGPAAHAGTCVVDHAKLTEALSASVKPSGGPTNGGFDNNEWAAVVARDGTVCAVTYSGERPRIVAGKPGHSGVKGFHRKRRSLPNFALATANLYSGSGPDGSLYGVITSNPPNPSPPLRGQGVHLRQR